MSNLTGTVKQIEWAREIRERRDQELAVWLEQNVSILRKVGQKKHLFEAMEETVAKITAEVNELLLENTDARYWIGTRNQKCYELLNDYFKGR